MLAPTEDTPPMSLRITACTSTVPSDSELIPMCISVRPGDCTNRALSTVEGAAASCAETTNGAGPGLLDTGELCGVAAASLEIAAIIWSWNDGAEDVAETWGAIATV